MDDQQIFLTKAEILQGQEHTTVVEISRGTLEIRPLTLGEKAHAEASMAAGIKTTGNASQMSDPHLEGDAISLVKNLQDYNFYVAACGLSIKGKERWTPKEVSQMTLPEEDFEKLVEAIEVLSGMKKAELQAAQQVRTFREVEGRTGIGRIDTDVSIPLHK